ncbi:MAG: peroxide stress protein YaaA [Blautia sp.]|jgi:cytoplasmic iron level regulating protein YaaA (DUF328/UPF0246 family)
MRIIISPAKKMNDWGDLISGAGLSMKPPVFLEEASRLQKSLADMGYEELRALWRCNEKIAAKGWQRLQDYSIQGCKDKAKKTGRSLEDCYLSLCTPALLAYEGIQYQYMAPQVFTRGQWEYAQEHLRILSGFYGILCPMDGVVPYRLEMQAKLSAGGAGDLYGYWGRRIFDELTKDCDLVVNLASKEYSKAVEKYRSPGIRFVSCVFGEEKDGKIRVKGTRAKMARGEMVRYLTECRAQSSEQLKAFTGLGYRFVPEISSKDQYVFVHN